MMGRRFYFIVAVILIAVILSTAAAAASVSDVVTMLRSGDGALPSNADADALYAQRLASLSERCAKDGVEYVWTPLSVENTLHIAKGLTIVDAPEHYNHNTNNKCTLFARIGGGGDDVAGFVVRLAVMPDAVVLSWQGAFHHISQFRRLAAVNEWNSQVGTVAMAYMDHGDETAGDVVVSSRHVLAKGEAPEARDASFLEALAYFVVELRVFESKYLSKWHDEAKLAQSRGHGGEL
eukprot:PhM_4_TR12552/c0_g1_i1/m.7503